VSNASGSGHSQPTSIQKGWTTRDDYTVWPHVKNLVPHQSIYRWGRLQEVWLDK
jgi:hypothetical protein